MLENERLDYQLALIRQQKLAAIDV